MHCHINLHAFGGMGIALMQGPDKFPQIPQYYLDWNSMSKARTLPKVARSPSTLPQIARRSRSA